MNDRAMVSMIAESPCRADLAGGTLDIWPLGLLHPGAVTVNVAIPVWVKLEVDLGAPAGELWHAVGEDPWRQMQSSDAATDLSAAVVYELSPGGGIRIRVRSQAPMGSGLGGSSAYAIALSRAVLTAVGEEIGEVRLVAIARDLEARILRVPTGVQDHWPALRGGALAIHHEAGGERVERLDVDAEWFSERLTIFNSGVSHHSGMVNWQVIRRRFESDRQTISSFEAIAEAARVCRCEILRADEEGVGSAIASEWSARKKLAPEVCPPEIEAIEEAAVAAGAMAVKACGAGGGGSVLVWHSPDVGQTVRDALKKAAPAGGILATGVSKTGCRVRTLLGDS